MNVAPLAGKRPEAGDAVPLPGAVSIDGVSKIYRIYSKPLDVLTEAVTRKKRHQEFWALRDVNVKVKPGEITGIVGRNGAGKSTLLKIVSGTLAPTTGKVDVAGKIAAILELGTGFHPEFTGRENVYIGGMCLGLVRSEIDERIDDIIAFSGLGEFIDWPFKTYSSGMQSRLTFATATSVDPDVLIVDEALSVGDARFQRRSFARMEDYRRRGKTILLVSHDVNTMSEFCDTVVLMDHGRVLDVGDPKTVLLEYHRLLFNETPKTASAAAGETLEGEASEPASTEEIPDASEAASTEEMPDATEAAAVPSPSAPAMIDYYASESYRPASRLESVEIGSGAARIIDAAILDEKGNPERVLQPAETYRVWLRIRADEACEEVVPGILVKTTKGVDLFGWDSNWAKQPGLRDMKPGETRDVILQVRNNLADGTYFITFALADRDAVKYDVRYDLIQFIVHGTAQNFITSIVNLELEYSTLQIGKRP